MSNLRSFKDFYRNILWVAVGSVLYGILNNLMAPVVLPGAEFISLRPQLIIPVTASLLVGPFTGGLIGLLGNLFGDILFGFGFKFWHWCIANFIIGFVPGMVRWLNINEIKRVNEFGIVLIFIFMGNVLGLFEGFLIHKILFEEKSFLFILNAWYLPALISNTYALMLLMPPIFVITKFLKMNIETRSMYFVLLFSIMILTSIMLVSFGIEYRLLNQGIESNPRFYQELLNQMFDTQFRWLGILLILIIVLAGMVGYYFSRKYMQPINLLAKASDRLKNGEWGEENVIETRNAGGEMKNLITIFNSMAKEIQTRETKMHNAIKELELKINKAKEERMVSEITETDFFKSLELKSKYLKNKRTE